MLTTLAFELGRISAWKCKGVANADYTLSQGRQTRGHTYVMKPPDGMCVKTTVRECKCAHCRNHQLSHTGNLLPTHKLHKEHGNLKRYAKSTSKHGRSVCSPRQHRFGRHSSFLKTNKSNLCSHSPCPTSGDSPSRSCCSTLAMAHQRAQALTAW